MALDASNKEFVGICIGVLDEVLGRLFCWDGDERDTLISWFEPNDLGAFNRSPGFITAVTFTLATFSLLLFFGSGGRGTK